jgi:hypothetical protein
MYTICSSDSYGRHIQDEVELSLQRTKILFVKYEVHTAVDMKIILSSEACPLVESY